MKIHLIGAGEVGRHMAFRLSGDGHDIVLIEKDESRARELEDQLDAKVMVGDGCSPHFLAESGVGECELFLALTSCNNANLVSSSMAKQLGARKTICRLHPGLQREAWMFDFKKEFHVDYLFSSERLSAIELAKFICNPASVVVEEIARGKIELQQLEVDPKSQNVGKTLLDLQAPNRVRIAAITRDGQSFVPNAESLIQANDRLTIFGDPRKLRSLTSQLQPDRVEPSEQNVVIFGGGEYGYSLAQMLESWNTRTRILERDRAHAQVLAESLEKTKVINVDATSILELREEQVGEADFFVAASGNDEDNVMTCLQAHNLGAKHCLTLIHRADYADAISANGEHLGIMAAVSPREATRIDLMRFVTSDRFHLFKQLDEGEIIEMAIPENAFVVGKRVQEISWPASAVLVALINGDRAIVPGAEDVLEAGQNLYAMVAPESRKQLIKLITKKA
jgi:trk system potassium uptake protein